MGNYNAQCCAPVNEILDEIPCVATIVKPDYEIDEN